ncbi:retinin [Drosophila grimshawi]|uniref:GH15881 n=1 Tax=Drosophila grimshawi TaxID=7222 RepID=B4J0T5_DROGR|nr:retinin [Drosophila grimshawi]EDV95756.1 GH15881 [Drosophila grimshawi]
MFKLQLSLFAVVLALLDASTAGSLEWPANLVSLSTGKSSQSLPLPLQLPEESSAETASESSASSSAEPQLEEASESSAASSSADAAADAQLVPVSIPLPLILATRSGLRSVLTIQEPTLARLGELVEHVPSAISHQSQTVVHDHRRVVTPIVAPAVRTTKLVRQHPPLLWTLSSADPRVILLRN